MIRIFLMTQVNGDGSVRPFLSPFFCFSDRPDTGTSLNFATS
jgi:hypothetical protein